MWQSINLWRKRMASQIILVEAVVYLVFARLALDIFSFQRLTRLFRRPVKQPELVGSARIQARDEVRKAIVTIWRRMPKLTTCFQRAIAAQAMLRRRGVSTTLYFGALSLSKRGLATHVWLQDGDVGVMGDKIAQSGRYHILVQYPASNSQLNIEES